MKSGSVLSPRVYATNVQEWSSVDIHSYHTYIAPSWSWAACRTPCEFPDGIFSEREALIEILDIRADLYGSDPFGRLKSGVLKVRGWAKTIPADKYLDPELSSTEFFSRHFTFDSGLPGQETQTVLLFIRDDGHYKIHGSYKLEGLALRRVPESDQYQRIGRFTTFDKGFAWPVEFEHRPQSQAGIAVDEYKASLQSWGWKEEVFEIV